VLREDHQFGADGEERDFADVQVMLYSSEAFGPGSVRDLSSERVMKLVQLPGIVTSAANPKVSCLSSCCSVRYAVCGVVCSTHEFFAAFDAFRCTRLDDDSVKMHLVPAGP